MSRINSLPSNEIILDEVTLASKRRAAISSGVYPHSASVANEIDFPNLDNDTMLSFLSEFDGQGHGQGLGSIDYLNRVMNFIENGPEADEIRSISEENDKSLDKLSHQLFHILRNCRWVAYSLAELAVS